jgi:hypothetical protein
MQAPATPRFASFAQFYPFYLSEHRNPTCRRLHFAGSLCVLAILAFALFTGKLVWLLALPLAGYGFAWLGHFAFEKNRPASFKYPLYSFMGDWVMFFHILTGKISMAPGATADELA